MSEFNTHLSRLIGSGFSQMDEWTFNGLYNVTMGSDPLEDLQKLNRWVLQVKDKVVVTEKEPRRNETSFLDKIIKVSLITPSLSVVGGVRIPFIKPEEVVIVQISVIRGNPLNSGRTFRLMIPLVKLTHNPHSHRFQFEMAYLGLLGDLIELCSYELNDQQCWVPDGILASVPTFNNTHPPLSLNECLHQYGRDKL